MKSPEIRESLISKRLSSIFFNETFWKKNTCESYLIIIAPAWISSKSYIILLMNTNKIWWFYDSAFLFLWITKVYVYHLNRILHSVQEESFRDDGHEGIVGVGRFASPFEDEAICGCNRQRCNLNKYYFLNLWVFFSPNYSLKRHTWEIWEWRMSENNTVKKRNYKINFNLIWRMWTKEIIICASVVLLCLLTLTVNWWHVMFCSLMYLFVVYLR